MRRFWMLVLAALFGLPVGQAQAIPPYAEEREEGESMWAEGESDDQDDASSDDEAEDEEEEKGVMSKGTFGALKFRSVGPALMSGRIGDIAVNPENKSEWFVAACSGGVWKTTNNGTTFEPVFDGEGSYSIGCVTIDPNNPRVVWVGSGENNSQRSVSWGDGIYKSVDGGSSWTNMGLKESEHIGMIAVDPRDSDVVYVAAQGPLWRSGGDRGLYKTTDGGETWERILHISDDTGVNEIHLDPRDPDTMYASAYQRRRHVWTLINGGPESGIHKSTDGGATWREIKSGIPKEDKGRIGMDISPADPDVVYAIIEAANGKSGFFRSTDRGETWSKRSDYVAGSPQYYNEIVCHPTDADTVYSLDTFMHVTRNGGESFSRAPREDRHVDDHALWIDPDDPDHCIVGCDGGVYITWDAMDNWYFAQNLPVTQFYRVSTDMSEPFYYIYGGTQDNNSQGGPSRTTDRGGITNADWFVTVGGDGYETQVDPTDPNIVYSQWQYAGLVRHDRRSGEIVDIKPREKPGDEPYVWNWDTPLLLSAHKPTRLYLAGRQVFRTEDRGDSWTMILDDVSRGIDRNTLEVMGRIQPADAVAKHNSTSIWGNAVSLAESPIDGQTLYVGSDDGLIHVTGDGGRTWREVTSEQIGDVPELTYVSCLTASNHEKDRAFVAFSNHKMGDFKPYLFRSDDGGRSWTNIAGDLPENHVVWSIQEDHEDPNLLFAGTEFGAFFTVNGGETWIELSGMPTIAARDLEIQRRENDLVAGTFGRGFYVLDDYTPLREVDEATLDASESMLFPVKDALAYIERTRLGGWDGRGVQGASYYNAENPPFGATFTYFLKEKLKTKKELRHEAEKEAYKADETPPYPSIEELRAESKERTPEIILTVRDRSGDVVRVVRGDRGKGMHRAVWDLRYPGYEPIEFSSGDKLPWEFPNSGPLVAPGTYSVTLAKIVDGQEIELAGPESFEVVPLNAATFAAQDHGALRDFRHKVGDLQRGVRGALKASGEMRERIKFAREAIMQWADAPLDMLAQVEAIDDRMDAVMIELRGDRIKSGRQEPTHPSISGRVENIIYDQWYVTSPPTITQQEQYDYAADAFEDALAQLNAINTDLTGLEDRLEELGAPWTPGRMPRWNR